MENVNIDTQAQPIEPKVFTKEELEKKLKKKEELVNYYNELKTRRDELLQIKKLGNVVINDNDYVVKKLTYTKGTYKVRIKPLDLKASIQPKETLILNEPRTFGPDGMQIKPTPMGDAATNVAPPPFQKVDGAPASSPVPPPVGPAAPKAAASEDQVSPGQMPPPPVGPGAPKAAPGQPPLPPGQMPPPPPSGPADFIPQTSIVGGNPANIQVPEVNEFSNLIEQGEKPNVTALEEAAVHYEPSQNYPLSEVVNKLIPKHNKVLVGSIIAVSAILIILLFFILLWGFASNWNFDGSQIASDFGKLFGAK